MPCVGSSSITIDLNVENINASDIFCFVPNDNSTIKIKVQSNRIIASEDDIYLISKKKNYKAYNKVNVGDYVYNKYEDIDYYCVYKSKNYIILKTL